VRRVLLILVAILALVAGVYFSAGFKGNGPNTQSESPQVDIDPVGSFRPDFRLASNSGEFVTPADYPGKTLLFNFWATWCAPCRHEIPMLVDLQNEYGPQGLQVIGIALDDVQGVRDFVDRYGISYPVLVGAADVMQTSVDFGNTAGVLPYSVLVDRDGMIRWRLAGEIERTEFVGILSKLL